MFGDFGLYLQALSLQVSPDNMPAVTCQDLILQGEQHLAQELVLPLPVHMVHREPQHPLSDALARHLGEMKAGLRSGMGTRDGIVWHIVLDTGAFGERFHNQGPVYLKLSHLWAPFTAAGPAPPGGRNVC